MISTRIVSRSSQAGSLLALETTLRLLVSGISHLYADAGEHERGSSSTADRRLEFVRGIRSAVEDTLHEGMSIDSEDLDEDEVISGAQASIARVFRALEREIEDGSDTLT
jgi:hypothetical protein